MPDARRTLDNLRAEWDTCRRCPLGVRREAERGAFVFGEGVPRGIMFIGEGPGWQEEVQGRPFVGRSGKILRDLIAYLHLNEYYISNVVACRSCEQATDAMGLPIFRERRGVKLPKMSDVVPSPTAIKECLPRLYEEIYLVDPVVIVSLGVPASEALLQRQVRITKERGKPQHIEIPGATWQASLTDKKGAWLRKAHGEVIMPTEQNQVRYLVVPTLHPALVLRRVADKGVSSPFRQFVEDVRHAHKLYERYLIEAHGYTPPPPVDISDEALEQLQSSADAAD